MSVGATLGTVVAGDLSGIVREHKRRRRCAHSGTPPPRNIQAKPVATSNTGHDFRHRTHAKRNVAQRAPTPTKQAPGNEDRCSNAGTSRRTGSNSRTGADGRAKNHSRAGMRAGAEVSRGTNRHATTARAGPRSGIESGAHSRDRRDTMMKLCRKAPEAHHAPSADAGTRGSGHAGRRDHRAPDARIRSEKERRGSSRRRYGPDESPACERICSNVAVRTWRSRAVSSPALRRRR